MNASKNELKEAIGRGNPIHVHTNEIGAKSIASVVDESIPFNNEFTDEYGDHVIEDCQLDTIINSPESLKEMEIGLLGIKPVDVQDGEHWLENEIPISGSSGFSFVGTGKESRSGMKIEIGLSKSLRNHIRNNDWRGDIISFVVGEYLEPKFGNSHWVAVNNGIWPAADITEKTAKGIWVEKKNRFAFTLTREYILTYRKTTKQGNQKLYLLVTFGRGALTGNSIWVNPA